MEVDQQSQKELISKCVRRAAKLRPCLCDFESDEEAIIDLYIKNTTKTTFKLVEESNIVASGSFAIENPGKWIVPPPCKIHRGETVFMRASSGKVSTTDLNTCTNLVDYTVSLRYFEIPIIDYDHPETEKQELDTFYIEVSAVRQAAEGSESNTNNATIPGCAGLKPFEPVTVFEFRSNFPQLNIYNLQPQAPPPAEIRVSFPIEPDVLPPEERLFDTRWRNTVYFILA